jgi:hypothetical protein
MPYFAALVASVAAIAVVIVLLSLSLPVLPPCASHRQDISFEQYWAPDGGQYVDSRTMLPANER